MTTSKFDPSRPIFGELPPPETIRKRPTLNILNGANTGYHVKVPEGCDTFEISCVNEDRWETTFDVEFYGPEEEIPNPRYDVLLRKYKERKEAFDKKLAQWELDKEKYDRDKAKNDELAEKVLYEKLKRKYEPKTN